MKSKRSILFLAAALLAACGEETRKGELILAGSNPVRIIDESGAVVEFFAGPTKVEFAAGRSNKFTVTVSQGDAKKAKFSGKAPSSDDSWNFTLRGSDIGQPIDLASRRDVEYTGKPWRQIGEGGSCGWGRWVTEEEYQNCNEDWKVGFADAATSSPLGSFHSRRERLTCHLSTRNLYCRDDGRDRYPHPPYPRGNFSKAQESIKKLSVLSESGIRFD